MHDYRATHEADKIEVLNVDTREGAAIATLYDIVAYPAILIVQADGYVQKIWQGSELPLMEEVSSYANA